MPQAQEVAGWIGWEVVDVSGEKIGKLEAIYLDAETDQPEWALIKTGLFGGSSPLVPLMGAEAEGETVRVNFPKDQVKGAPSMKANEELSQQEEARLYEHYGLEYSFVPSGSGLAEGGGQQGAAGAAATGGTQAAGAPDEQQGAGSAGATAAGAGAAAAGAGSADDASQPGSAAAGPQPGSAGEGTGAGSAGEAERGAGGPASMPASGQPQGAESQGAAAESESGGAGPGGNLAASQAAAASGAGAQSAEPSAGAAGEASEVIRLRKYIVTEHVPVQHEEVRVEREPIDESNKEA